jgi:site-specific DNA recombinase
LCLEPRWSTDDQGSGTTLEEQRETCLRWASERVHSVSPEHIFVDDGVSGAKEHRPALDSLNRLIQRGEISLVIVYKLDRLARRPYLSYKLVEDWRGKASLISVTESHIDTTTTVGELGFGIATVFASHERNTIRDRTMSGKRRRAAEGRNPGLRPPYGYAVKSKRFTLNEDEAVMVRRVYAEYLAGRTDGQIARMLNDSGIRTRKGGPWHISAVQRVLQNPAYKGTLVYRDIITEHAFSVVIEPETWEQVQALRSQKAKWHPRRMGSESPYILSGRLFCSQCGRPMNGRVCRNGKYENRYYACTGYIQFRECDCLTVRQELLEEAVIAHLLPLLDENELSRRMTAHEGTIIEQFTQEVAFLELRLHEIDQQLARVRQDYRQGLIDAHTFNQLRIEIEADRATLSSSLSAKRSELTSAQGFSRLGEGVRQVVSLLQAWAGINLAQRKQVIHLLTNRIVWDFHNQTLTIETGV